MSFKRIKPPNEQYQYPKLHDVYSEKENLNDSDSLIDKTSKNDLILNVRYFNW